MLKRLSITRYLTFFVIMLALFFSVHAKAANVGDMVSFNVDPNYDATGRSQVQATLVKSTAGLYFYIETNWWNSQTQADQNKVLADFDALSIEFTNNIYPKLTSVYGSEWNPGIDGDSKITLLFESLNNNLGGYFRSADEYVTLQEPDSNQREMLYMPIDQINSSQLKVFLAHEFVHLIVFNQKDRLEGVSEETWLSEARSDYASTILGYDDVYSGSNLQRRVQDFLNQPSNSLIQWGSTKYDYAVEDLFMHYLVDHYGIRILTDSLHSKLVGIASLDQALSQNDVKENFPQIFTNWVITLMVNDCSQNQNYCYTDNNLNSLKINPSLIFLPLTGDSSLSVNNITEDWAGNWEKIIGGSGDLTLDFSGLNGLNFQVPYILYDKNDNYTVNFLQLNDQSKGELTIKNFGADDNSLILIPFMESGTIGFDGTALTYPYSFTVSVTGNMAPDDPVAIQKLLDQITALKQQIANIQAGKNTTTPQTSGSCTQLNTNLYFGLSNNTDVRCLQAFLKSQGTSIYPQGLITGNFGALTKSAVIRFQNQYKSDILTPVNLSEGNGFVGSLTRLKINEILKNVNLKTPY